MMPDSGGRTLLERWSLIAALSSSVSAGTGDLATAITALRKVIAEGAWMRFTPPSGMLVEWGENEFESFVTAKRPRGLATDMKTIKENVVGKDTVLLAKLERLDSLAHPNGVHPASDIITSRAASGTSREQALRKLRKDAPALHAEVLAGNIKPHAAMVKAGFRKPTTTVRTDDPDAAMAALLRRYSREDLQAALDKSGA